MAAGAQVQQGLFARKSAEALQDGRVRQHRVEACGRHARPHRAGHRRDHRHRHLRDHRGGDRQVRAGDRHLVRRRRAHVPLQRAELRRAGVDDPGLGLGVHVQLRDARRARRVDHRLGPDHRVRLQRGGGRGRLGRVPAGPAVEPLRDQHPGLDRRAAGRRRHVQPARGGPRARDRGAADRRRARERAHEHGDGRHEARDPACSSSSSASPRSTATTSRRSQPHGFSGDDGRRGADLLRLHRLRRGLDVGRARHATRGRDLPKAIIGVAADRDRASTSSSRSQRSGWRRPTSSPAPTRR